MIAEYMPLMMNPQYRHALAVVAKELQQAREKYPDDTWPKDPVRRVAIMVEEAGEAVRAANDVEAHDTPANREALMVELAQTGAMCLRCLAQLDTDPPPGRRSYSYLKKQ